MAPILKTGMADVKTWDDVKLLTVAVNRLQRWTRPGLLCIGDAAHAMSPVGGVGVNLAVQDAVATANLLAARLAKGCPSEDELDAVRLRRTFPVRMTQAMQRNNPEQHHQRRAQAGQPAAQGAAAAARWSAQCRWLQGLTARFLAIGVRPEHVAVAGSG